ncbi:MAG: hypothetical protein KIT73_14700, partial [Burkholderiales bacterium]|nr:hypothetical protein [Burkholderiales bacterium]
MSIRDPQTTAVPVIGSEFFRYTRDSTMRVLVLHTAGGTFRFLLSRSQLRELFNRADSEMQELKLTRGD